MIQRLRARPKDFSRLAGIAASLQLAPLDIEKETFSRTHAGLVCIMTMIPSARLSAALPCFVRVVVIRMASYFR
jgi:hypothetical protein